MAKIPDGVYYCDGNFYAYGTGVGQGAGFYNEWRDRASEFPQRFGGHRGNPDGTTSPHVSLPSHLNGPD